MDVLKKYWSDIPEKKKPLSMNESTCRSAAWEGHLEVLKWLRSQGCPWDEETYRNAGGESIRDWLRENGCPTGMPITQV